MQSCKHAYSRDPTSSLLATVLFLASSAKPPFLGGVSCSCHGFLPYHFLLPATLSLHPASTLSLSFLKTPRCLFQWSFSALICLDLSAVLDMADGSSGTISSFDFATTVLIFPYFLGTFFSSLWPLNVGVAESVALSSFPQHLLFLGDLTHICSFMTLRFIFPT